MKTILKGFTAGLLLVMMSSAAWAETAATTPAVKHKKPHPHHKAAAPATPAAAPAR